ncbi:tetratricopeptide repeat protein [Polaribacter litorisediminis]|uniref:tetratricopeptide repeat protein n=1 Tax=Polaribacter litorisediminis TaxID=1908341 RepID=UPI001CC1A062|nr:tetratricopeptide repeat protein [Polaribacter litorisediminis]UAM97064.1 tetratricopeptide repeat protein [Polaribacter litorisediminis]
MKKKILIVVLFVMVKVEAQTSTFAVSDSLFAKGRYQLALKELDKSAPSFLSNYKTAVIYESIDNYKKAANFLEKALTFKDDEKTKLKLAKNYRSLKLSQKAIPIYEDILAKDSLNLVLKYQLGKLYIINRKPKKAITTFQYLIKNDLENANYSYYLGLAYALNGERDPMINSFIDTFEKDTLHIKSITRLAKSFHKLKDVDSTQLFVNKGLVISPDDFDLNQLKINQLFKEKKYKETLPFLLNIDTLYTKDTYSINALGKVYYNLDSLEKAKKYFTKLSYLDPEEFKANTYLGHIALQQKDYKVARMHYVMASFKGKRSRDEEFYGMATVYYEMKKPQQAIRAFENAYKENTRNYRALYQLAKLSDDYYKEKKIAYKHYIKYIETFYETDEGMSAFVRSRIKEIKKEYFLRGESLK